VKQNVNGVCQDVRRLTVTVFEWTVESAIGRMTLDRGDRAEPWTVVSALFASMFAEAEYSRLAKEPNTMQEVRNRYQRLV
jgi:hypothetical protein